MTNQVIDDWQGNGKVNVNLGGWFPAAGDVADGCWDRDDAQAVLTWNDSTAHGPNDGSRSAVRI
jgi:hypothetical protein